MTIKEIRQMSGLSQTDFAAAYGIPRRTLQNWELDVRKPPIYLPDLLERLVKEDFQK